MPVGSRWERRISIPTLAAVYIGTVVGAGFASGQEVLQFFSLHGLWGLPALGLATGILALFGYLILRAGHRLEAGSYGPVLRHVAGPVLGRVIDVIMAFFLFGGLAAMFAGAGATLEQEYGLAFEAGLLLMAAATVVTVLAGIGGVVTSVSFVVPLLLTAVAGVSIATLLANPVDLSFADPARAAVPHWGLSGLAYGSYNLLLSISVLAPVARFTPREGLLPGAILGAVGLGLGALAVNLTVLALIPGSTRAEVPMALAATRLSPLVALAYTAVLLAEVYTTAVGSLFGLVSRAGAQGRWLRYLTIGLTVAAMVAGRVGFSTIVATLFPAVGYAGFLFLGALLLAAVERRI